MGYRKYSVYEGVKSAKRKVSLVIVGLAALVFPIAIAASSGAALAANNFSITPWTYVGAAGDCGTGYPAGTPGAVVSKWDYTTGNPAPSLYLQKNAPTGDCSSAGATVNGVSGITLTELNFQYQNNNGGHCGAGAPRYDVVTSDGVTHFFGCADGTQTIDTSNPAWTEVSWDVNNPAQAFPVIAPGTTVKSIDVVFDEGTDVGSGFVNLDNFSINGQIIGGPNTPVSKDACKKGGWQKLTDANGTPFKNQGDCVSYVATNGKNPANG